MGLAAHSKSRLQPCPRLSNRIPSKSIFRAPATIPHRGRMYCLYYFFCPNLYFNEIFSQTYFNRCILRKYFSGQVPSPFLESIFMSANLVLFYQNIFPPTSGNRFFQNIFSIWPERSALEHDRGTIGDVSLKSTACTTCTL